MEKEFLPYDLALELKGLGFDEPCFGFCIGNSKIKLFNDAMWESRTNSQFIHYFTDKDISAVVPTYSQSFRWFREKHNLSSQIESYYLEEWSYFFKIEGIDRNHAGSNDGYSSYEKAELACLRKLIEIVKS